MEIVRAQVLLGGADNRVVCSGPILVLDAQATVHLGLVLHELATNALKYGALSVPDGRLSVKWEIRTNGEREILLEWKESGGPKVTVPKEYGFSSTLIERTLKGHGGKASIRYGAEGLTGQITLPLPEQDRPNIGVYATPLNSDTRPLLQQLNDESALRTKRIIIIEDEPLVAMDLESTLTAAGCEVIGAAGTLVEASALSMNADCDAALVDVNLADHSVDEIAATLTKRNIPFAFVTGYGREALPQGFRDAVIVRKPFNQYELIAAVDLLIYQAPGVVQLRRKEV